MRRLQNTKLNRAGGFSLVELLAVIGIIGILAAIIVPSLVNTTASSDDIKARRNAQTIASLASQARAIGGTMKTNSDKIQAVRQLMGGVQGAGSMHNVQVKLSPLSDSEIDKAATFLEIQNGTLSYRAP